PNVSSSRSRYFPYPTLFRSAAAQDIAADLPALPAGGEFGVVLQASQHEARLVGRKLAVQHRRQLPAMVGVQPVRRGQFQVDVDVDRKSTRLNSSHVKSSYAV